MQDGNKIGSREEMDTAVENIKDGITSDEIDLSEF